MDGSEVLGLDVEGAELIWHTLYMGYIVCPVVQYRIVTIRDERYGDLEVLVLAVATELGRAMFHIEDPRRKFMTRLIVSLFNPFFSVVK